MVYLFLGFFTGLSLILAIGAQNIFVIEQGLKKQYIFLVCLICSVSDLLLIFIGILIFAFFQNYFNHLIELILNILLILFLSNFIWKKWNEEIKNINFIGTKNIDSRTSVCLKTLGFTYLNPHVYSDTIFFMGNFSKNFALNEKILFGLGASFASFIFFFLMGYLASYFSNYFNSEKIWKIINNFIVIFMSFFIFLVLIDTYKIIF
tara:strand:+ start:43 stop:660 length:618 start_codon:yes stop_codon:yes gene_type:complete